MLRLIPLGDVDQPALDLPDARPRVLGRAPTCELVVTDPRVSSRHALLAKAAGSWLLTDLGSRHGTWAGGTRLQQGVPQPIDAGDVVSFGPLSFRVERVAMPAQGQGGSGAGAGSAPGNPSTIRASLVGGPGRDDLVPATRGRFRDEDPVASQVTFAPRTALVADLDTVVDSLLDIASSASEKDAMQAAVSKLATLTGAPRVAYVEPLGGGEAPRVLASHPQGLESFDVSRSLLRVAAQGEVAQILSTTTGNYGESIAALGIQSALCAPVTMGPAIVGYLYLDARSGERIATMKSAPACARAVASMCGLTLTALRGRETQRRHALLEHDLNAAREVQAQLLPDHQGQLGGFRYTMRMQPGQGVAGDLFDIMPLAGGRVGFFVGDVAGKGMSAGMVMAVVFPRLRSILEQTQNPAEAVNDINTFLFERFARPRSNASGAGMPRMLTLLVAVCEPDGTVHYVDAGHDHWLLKQAGKPAARITSDGSLPAGVDLGTVYVTERLHLEPGASLLVFTDGLREQRNAQGEEFGYPGIARAIPESADGLDTLPVLFRALENFAGGASFADDVTIAAIRREA